MNTTLEKPFQNNARHDLDSRIARMFYIGGLPFNFARSPHYRSSYAFAATHSIPGYLPSGYNALRTTLLQKERAHVERLLKPIKDSWLENGVSIVSDGWSDPQRRPLINIMAVSDGGPVFIKAIDGSGEFKDKHYIAGVLKDAIKEIGHEKIVQVITDNANVMKAAGALIEGEYPKIFWTPCVVHTLNLALKNICAAKNTEKNEVTYEECSWITRVAEDLVYVHSNLRLLSRRNEEYIHTATKMWDIAGDSWNESDMHGGVGILENAALTLDEPELEAIVIGNVNTSATTSESEVRSKAIDLEDDDICV